MKLAVFSLILFMLMMVHNIKPLPVDNVTFDEPTQSNKVDILSHAAIMREIAIVNREHFADRTPPVLAKTFDSIDNEIHTLMTMVVKLGEHDIRLNTFAKNLQNIEANINKLVAENSGAVNYVVDVKHTVDKLLLNAVEAYHLAEKNIIYFSQNDNPDVANLFDASLKKVDSLIKPIIDLTEYDESSIAKITNLLKTVQNQIQMDATIYDGIKSLAPKAEVIKAANALYQEIQKFANEQTDINKKSLANILVQDIKAFLEGIAAVPDTSENMIVVRQQLDYIQKSFDALKKNLSS